MRRCHDSHERGHPYDRSYGPTASPQGTVKVFSEPKDGRYQQVVSHPWGATVELPAPVSITLKTEKLKDYA